MNLNLPLFSFFFFIAIIQSNYFNLVWTTSKTKYNSDSYRTISKKTSTNRSTTKQNDEQTRRSESEHNCKSLAAFQKLRVFWNNSKKRSKCKGNKCQHVEPNSSLETSWKHPFPEPESLQNGSKILQNSIQNQCKNRIPKKWRKWTKICSSGQ